MASGEEKPPPKILENYGLETVWRLRNETFRRLRRLGPSTKDIGLSLAKSYASGPYELVVISIPLFAPSFITVP